MAYNAAIAHGVLTYWTPFPDYPTYSGFYGFGGTSAGAPQWAAIAAGLGSPKVDGIVGRLIALTSPGDAVAAIATSKPHANGQPGFAGQKQAR